MREAVIVSYARTGLAKAARGGFNNTSNMTMLGAAIEQILLNCAPRIPQAESKATYASKLDRESGRIDWLKDCWYHDRLIRAMNPWPGAYTLVRDAHDALKKLKIHRALPVHRLSGEPGRITGIRNRGIEVACGEGGLLLLEVQIEGKRAMPAAEFQRGFHLPSRFDATPE